MMRLLIILLFPICASAQCGNVHFIHAPRVGDSLHIDWSAVAQAAFYYVYVYPANSTHANVYIASGQRIHVIAPSTIGFRVRVRPSCQSPDCCPNQTRP